MEKVSLSLRSKIYWCHAKTRISLTFVRSLPLFYNRKFRGRFLSRRRFSISGHLVRQPDWNVWARPVKRRNAHATTREIYKKVCARAGPILGGRITLLLGPLHPERARAPSFYTYTHPHRPYLNSRQLFPFFLTSRLLQPCVSMHGRLFVIWLRPSRPRTRNRVYSLLEYIDVVRRIHWLTPSLRPARRKKKGPFSYIHTPANNQIYGASCEKAFCCCLSLFYFFMLSSLAFPQTPLPFEQTEDQFLHANFSKNICSHMHCVI